MLKKRMIGSAGVLLVLAVTAGSTLAGTRQQDAAMGVKALIEQTNALMKRHGSLKEFTELFFEDDLMIAGEGDKVFYKSLKAFEKPLAGYVADQTRCKLTVVDPVRASGTVAAAFVQMHCDPAKSDEQPVESRILYVFRKGAKGWRAMMEMYTAGVL
jgi:ketosteroid isomerase-like protein